MPAYCLGVVTRQTPSRSFIWVLCKYYADWSTIPKTPGAKNPRWMKDRDFECIPLARADVNRGSYGRPKIPQPVLKACRLEAARLGLPFRPDVWHNVPLDALEALSYYQELEELYVEGA